ncbi:MAG: SsrA-binding protein [Flavobacteriales bacterium CG18_big_fil_WC_8_21_14_2_50_32_9]|nr:SsrA-binding protein SmpB [Bacteroidota bacterium]PIQ14816.1 MAG: SsrA-binding protein [Flavobacteriales bacterium CG18_big_fil_WC_8_21_14_2_50_32_9]PJC62289.1 MAG: SsrA-binding protein [Flavobacteriales bacterium CG_4_9_14_0_2_um_filter_32_27]
MASNINIKNRRASFEYEFLEKFTAGIQLTGTEIKSVRAGKVNITDGFCFLSNGELFIKNMYIAEYEQGTYNNHEPKRTRKLLLNRNEIDKLQRKKKDVGLTIIPLSLFINKKGFAKLDIALAKGKKLHDKREDLKAKDTKREMDRAKKF